MIREVKEEYDMEKLGRKIVRFRIPIFIIGLLLLIPSVFGYINTRVNL